MKSRETFTLTIDTDRRFHEAVGNYKKSSVIESIIKQYLDEGDYSEVPKIKRAPTIAVCFTIDPEIMAKFRKNIPIDQTNYPEIFPAKISQSLEHLIKRWLNV
jgi:hypothetical protein